MSTAAASLTMLVMTSLVVLVLVMTSVAQVPVVNGGASCKSPPVEARLLADDARAASPFYVLALPRTAESSRIDNICYTYFDRQPGPPQSPFLHLMSVTNSDGSDAVHEFTKGDIAGRPGLAIATGLSGGSECIFHDYTLRPICDSSVFILYRCFIQGECASGAGVDAGRSAGVDVRVALSATPTVTAACLAELRAALRDTASTGLAGADYAILPRRRPPRCATRYNGTLDSIGAERAMAPAADRFGADAVDKLNANKSAAAIPTATQPGAWMNYVTAVQQHNAVKPATVAGYGQTPDNSNNGHNIPQPASSSSTQQQSHQQEFGRPPCLYPPAYFERTHAGRMMRRLLSPVRTWWKIALLYSLLTAAYACLVLVWSCYYVLSCQWCRRQRRKHPYPYPYNGYHHHKCPHNHHPSMQMKFQEDCQ